MLLTCGAPELLGRLQGLVGASSCLEDSHEPLIVWVSKPVVGLPKLLDQLWSVSFLLFLWLRWGTFCLLWSFLSCRLWKLFLIDCVDGIEVPDEVVRLLGRSFVEAAQCRWLVVHEVDLDPRDARELFLVAIQDGVNELVRIHLSRLGSGAALGPTKDVLVVVVSCAALAQGRSYRWGVHEKSRRLFHELPLRVHETPSALVGFG